MKENSSIIKEYLEPFFEKELNNEFYDIKKFDATIFLTATRFDLAFKLFYLDMKNKNEKLAKTIYKEHIRAFSLGKFTEPGNENKDKIEKFIEEFDKIFESINQNGFDRSKTIIPLSSNGSIANGAHRVASAIYLKEKVSCVQLETNNHIYDYKFFYNRNISTETLEVVVQTFIKYTNNTHIAFIWPIAKATDEEIEKLIPNIIYKKEILFTPNGAHNLLSQIYYGEEWLGNIENNFAGSQGKLVKCFKTFTPVKIIAFQGKNLEEVLKIKEKIRQYFNVGKHSIHITDTKQEAIRTAKIVFNVNSIHFLNYANPNKYISIHEKIFSFKKAMQIKNISIDDTILVNDIILSLYGLREKVNIKYLCTKTNQLKYHKNKIIDIIYNPKYYFYFNDVKFISFNQLYKIKLDIKDIKDCNMMEALIENNKINVYMNKFKQNILYTKIKIKQKIINILIILGIHSFLKKIIKGNWK